MDGYPSATGAWDASAGVRRDARADAFRARRDVDAGKSVGRVLDGQAQAARWLPVARQSAVEAEPGLGAALCTPDVGPSAEQSCAASAPLGPELWRVGRSWPEWLPLEALLAPEAATGARWESAASHWVSQLVAEVAQHEQAAEAASPGDCRTWPVELWAQPVCLARPDWWLQAA